MLIEKIIYGEAVLKGKTYYGDVVVWWDGRHAMLQKTHLVDIPLLQRILKKKPDAVVIGIGLEGTVKIDPKVRKRLEAKKVSLFVDRTMNAMEIYNSFVKEGKKAVGIMHVTL